MNEGDKIATVDLIENWDRIFKFYDHMIDQGSKLRPIRFLVRYIIDQKYSTKFFGGTSLYSLLISLPADDMVDYTKTLQVKYDELTQVVEFNYHNKKRNQRTKENRDWSMKCQATEIIATFEYFLNENEDWKK